MTIALTEDKKANCKALLPLLSLCLWANLSLAWSTIWEASLQDLRNRKEHDPNPLENIRVIMKLSLPSPQMQRMNLLGGLKMWIRLLIQFHMVNRPLNLELMPQKRGEACILTVTLPKAFGLFRKASYTSMR